VLLIKCGAAYSCIEDESPKIQQWPTFFKRTDQYKEIFHRTAIVRRGGYDDCEVELNVYNLQVIFLYDWMLTEVIFPTQSWRVIGHYVQLHKE